MAGTGQSRGDEDAVTLLKQDHRDLTEMFEEYAMLCDGDAVSADKAEVAGRICMALTLHTQVEEELFYPAVREAGSTPT